MKNNENLITYNEQRNQENKKNFEGLFYHFKNGKSMMIKEYLGFKNCTVIFDDETIVYGVNLAHFKTGSVRNYNEKSVCNVGFLGIGKYNSSTNKTAYDIWRGIISRCYSTNIKKSCAMYKDCTVDTDWHNFQNFAKWFEENYVDGFDLDKDLLYKGNKVYSAKTCCFLPSQVNSLFVIQKSKRNNGIIGVQKVSNKFSVMLKIKNKPTYLGLFVCQQSAFLAYKKAKEQNIKNMANEFKEFISEKAYRAMIGYKVEITD